jgi:hypothetical protein
MGEKTFLGLEAWFKVECQPSKYEALSSTPPVPQNKKKILFKKSFLGLRNRSRPRGSLHSRLSMENEKIRLICPNI